MKIVELSKTRCHQIWRPFLLILLIFLMTGGLIFVFRSPILTAVASAWIIDDSVSQADAIVVLGGGVQTRPFKAAELYRYGFAKTIVVMNVEPSPTTHLKLTPSEADMTRAILEKEGVPTNAIAIASRQVSSTFEETLAVKEWALSNRIQRLLIPTSLFHTRRVKWIFGRTLKGSGIKLEVVAVPEKKYSKFDWWKHEEGLLALHSELLKMIFYKIKY